MAKTGRKLAVGALVAGVAGYVAGILTAPKSGRETREDIKDATTRATREAEKKLKVAYHELSDLVDEGKQHANDAAVKGKQGYEEAMTKATDMRDKLKELLTAVRDGDVDDPELQKVMKDADALKTHLKKFLTTKK